MTKTVKEVCVSIYLLRYVRSEKNLYGQGYDILKKDVQL
jgi:hypothetical protein